MKAYDSRMKYYFSKLIAILYFLSYTELEAIHSTAVDLREYMSKTVLILMVSVRDHVMESCIFAAIHSFVLMKNETNSHNTHNRRMYFTSPPGYSQNFY